MSLIGQLRQGDISGAIKKIEDAITEIFIAAPTVLETFAKQFATDFGLDMLNKAEALAPQVLSGAVTIQDAATTLLAQATKVAVSDAEKDGTVAFNALRVHVEALKVSTPVATVEPAAPVA